MIRGTPLPPGRSSEHQVIQPGQAVVVLPGEAFGGVDGTLKISGVAVGPEELVAFDGSTLRDVVETGEHTALRICQI